MCKVKCWMNMEHWNLINVKLECVYHPQARSYVTSVFLFALKMQQYHKAILGCCPDDLTSPKDLWRVNKTVLNIPNRSSFLPCGRCQYLYFVLLNNWSWCCSAWCSDGSANRHNSAEVMDCIAMKLHSDQINHCTVSSSTTNNITKGLIHFKIIHTTYMLGFLCSHGKSKLFYWT